VHRLFNSFLAPVSVPVPYEPSADVVAIRAAAKHPVFAEVFARPGGTLGVRFSAWVAWRDAGGDVRSHTWFQIATRTTVFLDSQSDAETYAEGYARGADLELGGDWRAAR
jgi:hypothetical protein